MPPQPLNQAQRMSYRIGRGEQGVLTFEPYKSEILPLWRFKTPPIARKSSREIYAKFLEYNDQDDFIGMDMARKFLQMGMTRAKRYANHVGGRKYDKKTGVELDKSEGHKGREDKLEASLIFRELWERAKTFDGYVEKKEIFIKEQKQWDQDERKIKHKANRDTRRMDNTQQFEPDIEKSKVDKMNEQITKSQQEISAQ